MSETVTETKVSETPKITTVTKEKDPKRVEAGKRLAAISKGAQERKMRDRIELENQEKREKKDAESWDINYGYVVGVAGLAVGIGTLYYMRREDKRQEDTQETKEGTDTKSKWVETHKKTEGEKPNTSSDFLEEL